MKRMSRQYYLNLFIIYILLEIYEIKIIILKMALVKAKKIGYTNHKSARMKVAACFAFFREPVVGGNR